jgi:hypothetical protein
MEKGMNQLLWYTVKHWRYSFHASAKAGSQTLLKSILYEFNIPDPGMGNRRAVVHHRLVKTGKVLATPTPEYEAIQFVRDPKERFESLWRWGCRGQNQGIPSVLWDAFPNDLLWHIWDNLYDNVHWCPQFVVSPYADHKVAIEEMAHYLPGVVGPANRTEGEVPPYDHSILAQLYDLDYKCCML